MLKGKHCDIQNVLLETSEVPTPKCVRNEIRDFEMTTVKCDQGKLHNIILEDETLLIAKYLLSLPDFRNILINFEMELWTKNRKS